MVTNRDLKEVYALLGGNYDLIVKRLRNEEIIRSFMEDFLEDEEFTKLEKAMEAQDERAAFEAAHTLKGVALNMEFGFLSQSLIALTEALRHGKQPNAEELYETVREDYLKTIQIISE